MCSIMSARNLKSSRWQSVYKLSSNTDNEIKISWRRGYKRAIKQKEGISDVSYIHFVKPYRIAVNCDSQKTKT